MAELSLCAHLPLLRIEPPSFDAGTFQLWRMPFDVFDGLTLRAFGDHRRAYEATAPVFLRVDMQVDASADGLIRPVKAGNEAGEAKLPTASWSELLPRYGLGMLAHLHDDLLDRLSAALALAAPASLLPRSRWSVTFAQVDDEHAFVLPGQVPRGSLRVQGDADMEYCFAPLCTAAPLDAATLARAVEWQGMVDFIARDDELGAALQVLCDAGAPTLAPDDQSTLCCVALEALLLPELRSGLAATFATRASHLPGAGDAAALRDAAATLYDQRSAGVHGAAATPDARSMVASAQGAQWLAAAIVGAAHALRGGQTLEQWRAALDQGPLPAGGAPAWALLAEPAGLRAPERVSPVVHGHRYISRFATDALQGVKGAYALYAPLVGLGCREMQPLGTPPCPALLPLSGNEIVTLEDADTARDFLSELRLLPEQYAGLAIYTGEADHADEHAALAVLRRLRMLAVSALRLAGFDGFVDPELAGLHVLLESRPLREPSVLRQTVLIRIRQEPERFVNPDDQAVTAPMWDLLWRYRRSDGHADIERWLGLFLRLHHADFLAAPTRLGLAFALVEGLLGRYRAPDDPASVEAMVGRLLPPHAEAATWFADDSRALRNALAHGRLRTLADETPLHHLRGIARAALPRAIGLWLDQPDPRARPARLLMQSLAA